MTSVKTKPNLEPIGRARAKMETTLFVSSKLIVHRKFMMFEFSGTNSFDWVFFSLFKFRSSSKYVSNHYTVLNLTHNVSMNFNISIGKIKLLNLSFLRVQTW